MIDSANGIEYLIAPFWDGISILAMMIGLGIFFYLFEKKTGIHPITGEKA